MSVWKQPYNKLAGQLPRNVNKAGITYKVRERKHTYLYGASEMWNRASGKSFEQLIVKWKVIERRCKSKRSSDEKSVFFLEVQEKKRRRRRPSPSQVLRGTEGGPVFSRLMLDQWIRCIHNSSTWL